MVYIEKFLGKRVAVPEDRRYVVRAGCWGKAEGPAIRFGLTEPELVLAGGINDLEWLVRDEEEVEKGQSIAIAITGKIKYIEAPLAGVIVFNPRVIETPTLTAQDPYGQGWLFEIRPGSGEEESLRALASPDEYVTSLQKSEGGKNPDGLKGGVSGMCKAVYGGIREQKF